MASGIVKNAAILPKQNIINRNVIYVKTGMGAIETAG